MKQSIQLVILQVFSVLLGFVSVFWIASSLPSEEYAIVGVYNIISMLIVVFSNTGLETICIRKILLLKKVGDIKGIQLLVTQTIVYRSIIASVLFIPFIGYSYYMSEFKFEGAYLNLFLIMGVLSIPKAINDSVVLLLKAFNKYFAAVFVTYSVNVFGKIIALVIYLKFGFIYYIYVIMLLPFFINLPVIFMLKNYVNFNGVFNMKNAKEGFQESKYFAFSSYVSYVFNFIDQLLISIFMSAEILGSFTVAKSILSISRAFIENVFDPMTQSLVSFKTEIIKLTSKLNEIIKLKNILFSIALIALPVFIYFEDSILRLLNLSHYPFLNTFVVTIYISQVFYIFMKPKYNLISLFYPQKIYFGLLFKRSLISISCMLLLIWINVEYVFVYIVISNIFMNYYSNFLFKKYFKLIPTL